MIVFHFFFVWLTVDVKKVLETNPGLSLWLFVEVAVKWGCGGNTSPAQPQCSPDSVVACAKPCLMRWHKARSEGQCQEAAQAGLNQNSCSFSTSEFPHLLPDSVECVPLVYCANIGILYCLPAQPCVRLGTVPLWELPSPRHPLTCPGTRAASMEPWAGICAQGAVGWMCSGWDVWPEGQGTAPGPVEICHVDRDIFSSSILQVYYLQRCI